MKNQNSMRKRFASLFLILAVTVTMCLGMPGISFAGDQLNPVDMKIIVDAKDPVTVKAYNASYTYNTYVSMRDMAKALSGTAKGFAMTFDEESETMVIETGEVYTPVGGENEPGDGQVGNVSFQMAKMTIDGKSVKYYGYKAGTDNDFYIKIVDFSLALDIDADYSAKNTLKINTANGFVVDIDQLDQDGYFSFLHGTVLGNGDTGKILYSSKKDSKAAIASTTKLMTYLLVMEAIDAGKISMDDIVVLSKAVEEESYSEDYVIHMHKGQKATMTDLLEAMLVPSSNEAALALAEHVAGSEAAFVKMMNARAKKMGLTTAVFYNPHGLPNYTASAVTSKRQNSMSAMDLFTLASYVVKKYPKITDITSKKSIDLKSLDFQTSNTNPLLYNMEGVIGLKTGTTNRAGSCLVSAIPLKVGNKTQMIIAVELGAETSAERGEKSAVLLKYAQNYYASYNEAKAITVKASTSVKKGSVTVKWKTTGNADGYEVYRSLKKATGYGKKKTTTKTSYVNASVKKGQRYYYKVKAYKLVNGNKIYSSWSNVVTAVAK